MGSEGDILEFMAVLTEGRLDLVTVGISQL